MNYEIYVLCWSVDALTKRTTTRISIEKHVDKIGFMDATIHLRLKKYLCFS